MSLFWAAGIERVDEAVGGMDGGVKRVILLRVQRSLRSVVVNRSRRADLPPQFHLSSLQISLPGQT